jgi:hypothetical protein
MVLLDPKHDHRPDPAAMLAALDLGDAILADDRPGIRQAVSGAACPACVAIAAMSWAFTATSELAGEETFNSGAVARALAVLIARTRRELRSAGN